MHYRIVSKIRAGGMGKVYLARDNRLESQVAIRLLFDQFNKDPDRLHRFIQEARAASAQSPKIIAAIVNSSTVCGLGASTVVHVNYAERDRSHEDRRV
jgi:eukaryotic-like serine/threonine-protein kinase